MQKAKETASDMAASAKAGMEKARATVGGKTEKMTTSDPMRKEVAEEKKDERIREAEREKQGAYNQNAAARMAQQGGGAYDQNAAARMTQGVGSGFTTGGVQEPDVGGEGVIYDDEEVSRTARGPRGAGTRGYGTGGL